MRGSMKRIILALLIFLLTFAGIKAQKIKRYFVEERYYNVYVALGLAKRCYNPYKDQEDMFKQEGFDYIKMNQDIVLKSLVKLLPRHPRQAAISSADRGSQEANLTRSSTEDFVFVGDDNSMKIPTITHQIYFTPPERVEGLKKFYIENMKANFNRLNAIDNNCGFGSAAFFGCWFFTKHQQ